MTKGNMDVLSYVLRDPQDAADEIERLQDVKRRTLAIADERAIEAVKARAENTRLREALGIVLGDKTLSEILWADLPDDAPVNITIKLGAYRKAQAALYPDQQKRDKE